MVRQISLEKLEEAGILVDYARLSMRLFGKVVVNEKQGKRVLSALGLV